MTTMRLYAPKLFDGKHFMDNKVLTVVDGEISTIDENITHIDRKASGLVVPGYIDLQVNGGGGVLFNSYPSLAKLKIMASTHAQFGTTAMLPTLITDSIETMRQAADVIAQAIKAKSSGIVGIHFEGPHLALAKKGTHDGALIRPLGEAEWQILSRTDLGQIVVTLAPEVVSTTDIKRMVNLGIKVCLGHSNADYATAQQAVDAGASGFTHLYNAMSPLQGREPGMVGCALFNEHTKAGLIVDGHHVDFVSCQLAINAKPNGGVFLVTDAMPPVGTTMCEFPLYDRTVYVDNGVLRSTTGELAGSSLDMASAVKNTHVKLKQSLSESLRMASLYPAQYLYADQPCPRGELKVGMQADFLILNQDLTVAETWISGQQVYVAGS